MPGSLGCASRSFPRPPSFHVSEAVLTGHCLPLALAPGFQLALTPLQQPLPHPPNTRCRERWLLPAKQGYPTSSLWWVKMGNMSPKAQTLKPPRVCSLFLHGGPRWDHPGDLAHHSEKTPVQECRPQAPGKDKAHSTPDGLWSSRPLPQ